MIAATFFTLGSLTLYFTVDAWATSENLPQPAKFAALSGGMFVWLAIFMIFGSIG